MGVGGEGGRHTLIEGVVTLPFCASKISPLSLSFPFLLARLVGGSGGETVTF